MKYIRALAVRISSLIHCCWVKIFHIKNFSFSVEEIISMTTHFTISGNGEIRIGKKCGMRGNCEISAVGNGKINIGNNFFMNKGCIIASHDYITIGSNTRFGPNVMIFDHDYDFRNSDVKARDNHLCSPVNIGSNVWLGAGVIVLRGTTIGDNCVVGAGTVLKGNYEAGTMILQERKESVTPIRYQMRNDE